MAVEEGRIVRLKEHIRDSENGTARVVFKCPIDGECRLDRALAGRIRWSDEDLEQVPWKRG